jgi:hypothetical protein
MKNVLNITFVLFAAALICVVGCLPGESVAEKKSERDIDAQVDKVLDEFKGK